MPTVTFRSEKTDSRPSRSAYPDLSVFGFDNLISFVDFNYSDDVSVQNQPVGRFGPDGNMLVQPPKQPAPAAPIKKISFVVDAWANPPGPPCGHTCSLAAETGKHPLRPTC